MAGIDMNVDELKKYKGTNPVPDDFDEYWEQSIAEMKKVDANPVYEKASVNLPNVDCYELYFTSVGNAKIHCRVLKPKNITKPCPAVILFHGYSANCGNFGDKMSYVNMGFCVYALDCRGQTGLSQDTTNTIGTTFNGHLIRGLDDEDPKKMLMRNIYLDTAKLAEIAINDEDVDGEKVCVMGGSQGGGLATACAALEPRIKRAVICFPFLSDYKRAWDMNLAVDAYSEIKLYFMSYDPQHLRENEIFTKLGYIDVSNLAKRIKAEVLFTSGLMDTVCPPSTQFSIYNKIQSKKTLKLYPDFGHEVQYSFYDIAFEFLAKVDNYLI